MSLGRGNRIDIVNGLGTKWNKNRRNVGVKGEITWRDDWTWEHLGQDVTI